MSVLLAKSKQIVVVIVLTLLLLCWWALPAAASIHLYPEGDEQAMVRSLQTLRDRRGEAWQVVLFKRVKAGTVTDFHLRLVGFPGSGPVDHPQPLALISRGSRWTAPDVSPDYLKNAEAEYDVAELLNVFDRSTVMELAVPIRGGQPAELPAPPFVVKEWRKLRDRPIDEFAE